MTPPPPGRLEPVLNGTDVSPGQVFYVSKKPGPVRPDWIETESGSRTELVQTEPNSLRTPFGDGSEFLLPLLILQADRTGPNPSGTEPERVLYRLALLAAGSDQRQHRIDPNGTATEPGPGRDGLPGSGRTCSSGEFGAPTVQTVQKLLCFRLLVCAKTFTIKA